MGHASRKPLPRIAILAQPQASASVVFGMYDLFCSAGRDWGLVTEGTPGEPLLAPEIVAGTSEDFEVSNGVMVRPHRAFDTSLAYDIVCVPELATTPSEPVRGRFSEEVAWLRSQHARGALLATACSGSVLLAEAGLLAGNDATTHWAFCDALAENYPNVRVHRDRALVVTGEGQRLVMAGGGVSWLDLALYLIARVTTLEAAMQVARMNLIDWHHGGQVPYARLARTRQTDDATIAKCQQWIAERPNVEAPVASMVRLSGLPERTFKRRFRQATGMAPLEYVHTLRLEEAKKQLEISDEPLEVIAERAGYEDAAFFSQLFKRYVKLTPAQYRRRFGALRNALSSPQPR